LLSLQLQPTTGLSTESVQSAALAFQSVDDVHGCDGLALGVLSVRDCIADDVLKEDLQNTASLLVDETRDTLDTTSTCQTTDGWLRDALDVVTQHLSVTLRASFSKSFASFAASRHDVIVDAPSKYLMTTPNQRPLYTDGCTDPAEELTLFGRQTRCTNARYLSTCVRARARPFDCRRG
jgi:hypothetical protein